MSLQAIAICTVLSTRQSSPSAGCWLQHEFADNQIGLSLHLYPLWSGVLPGRARQLLYALGFRRRLHHRHLRAKAEERAACVAALEELLTDWLEEAWHWLLVNGVTVRRHPSLAAPCGLRDDVPDVPTGDDHTKRHVYGAVAPLTGQPQDSIGPEIGDGEFVKFLPPLLTGYPGKRLLVIHDRGQHQGALREGGCP